ncbi:MAG: 50S ribosomal protein L10 [Candidatus Magasanikbacteria bacterium]|nr:50S ribosomal protein L10 [Candidatus Magasanikbacteria bacterium]
MPKSKKQKQDTVGSLMSGLKAAKAVVFANFQGLTVAQSEELRKNSRTENVEMLAAKKTLVKRALDEAGITGIDSNAFQGGIATFLATGDEIAAAKVVSGFAKKHEIMTIFGGILEGKFIDAAAVKALAALPSKKELLGKLVGTLNAPVSGFVNVLVGNLRGLVSVLNNIKNAKA